MVIEELRIGNYVKCVEGNIIKINIDDMMCILTNTFEVRPIPLIEELLLRFGFEGSFDSIFTHAKIPCVYFKRPYMESKILLVKSVIGQDKITSVSSIHQLQNFFHSLTGKELEIKK